MNPSTRRADDANGPSDDAGIVLVMCVPNGGVYTSSLPSRCEPYGGLADDVLANAPLLLLRRISSCGECGGMLQTRIFAPFMQHALTEDPSHPAGSTAYLYYIDSALVSRAINAMWGTRFWCRCRVLPSTCDLYLVTEQGAFDRLCGDSKSNANLAFVTDHPENLSQSTFSELSFSVVLRQASELGQVHWNRTPAHGKQKQARTLGSSSVSREPFATPQLSAAKHLLPAWRPPPIVNPSPSHMTKMVESSLRTCRPLAPGPQSKKRTADERSDRRVITITNDFVVDPVVVSVKKAAASDAQLGITLITDTSARAMVLSVVAESPAAFFIKARDAIVAVGGVLCESSVHATQLLRDTPVGWVDILKGRYPGTAISRRDECADESVAEEVQLQRTPSAMCRKAFQSDVPHLRECAPNAGHWTLMPPRPGPAHLQVPNAEREPFPQPPHSAGQSGRGVGSEQGPTFRRKTA